MSKDILEFLQQTFGAYGQYIILTSLATIAFFYLANQFFSLKKLSLEHKGKKLEEVKALLEAVEKQKDLLIEEAFFLSYGFPVQSKEVSYVTARENQRNLILDLKNARCFLSYNTDSNSYEYRKRFSLKTRARVQATAYWLSAIMVYVTLLLAIGAKVYVLLIFVPVFGFTTYVSLGQLKYISAAERVLAGTQFPTKKANPPINTDAPTRGALVS